MFLMNIEVLNKDKIARIVPVVLTNCKFSPQIF
jgi:hypothetical protein